MSRMGRQQSQACGPNSGPHQKPGRFSLWPGRRATTTITTREEPATASSSGLMIDRSDRQLSRFSPGNRIDQIQFVARSLHRRVARS
ncbi:predicted protein [Sclerotinia sclerotiorum 1980 UF-70]|uniref:Uncharacterized protein n=1 Tax=Sclerotinia sclerotiorum (strain ATCC 18683 / 1980 / Ss-1) TaxID=665079 RepID=A7ED30_SCLS1|nr:predicted protein [Sclerotinia sclerotiorum 1980 UF-70]EDO00746.1 predicted protein [Sclerotinia sclerotiorum 1980 UF-70]